MALELNGTTGVSAVQADAVESGDLPAGSVIQVVSGADSGPKSTAANIKTGTNLALSITPTSATSKILIIATQQFAITRDNNNVFMDFYLQRDGSDVFFAGRNSRVTLIGVSEIEGFTDSYTINFLDAPSTNSSITYSVEAEFFGTGGTAFFNRDIDGASSTSTITLMEVAG